MLIVYFRIIILFFKLNLQNLIIIIFVSIFITLVLKLNFSNDIIIDITALLVCAVLNS